MEIIHLHRQGLSQRKIARKLGINRRTVKKYLEDPGTVLKSNDYPKRRSLLDGYEENIKAWLEEDIGYSGVWIYDHLQKLGFTGSYEIVKCKVRELKKKRQQTAYMRFETGPGCQAQVDFGEFQVERPDGGIDRYYLFSMILGYSRKIYAEFVEKCDMPGFLDCHIRAFQFFGGVPAEILYDRMRNVYIGKTVGKIRFNDTLTGFSLHYGFKPEVAPAYAAWVKGKVERPYRFIREGFWRGYGFICIETANRDLITWLKTKDSRIHGTTRETVSARSDREKPCLTALPDLPFDTSWRIYRKVQKDCTVRFDSNSYVVPHQLVGETVILRVKEDIMRIFSDNRLVVTYTVPEGKGHLVQDRRFYRALKNNCEMNARKYGNKPKNKARAKKTTGICKPLYDMDVEVRPLTVYDNLIPEEEIS